MKNENQHFSADRRKFGRHFWIGAAVAGALSAAVIFTAASAVYRKNRFDLKIGEEKVGSKEYQLCMDLVKYDVKMEIQKRYDALYGEDFWEQSYEGQYGYEILADHTVESYVKPYGYGVLREYVGHGIGIGMHEDPEVPNYGTPGHGPRLEEGMCICIEPMITMGSPDIITLRDGWGVVTADGLPSAHIEHTITITKDGPRILTLRN